VRLVTPISVLLVLLGASAPSGQAATPAPADTSAPAAEKIAWNDLVETVERTSPLMGAARSGLDAMEAQLRQAQWARFPKFRLEAGGTPTPEIQTDGFDLDVNFSRWGYFYRVSATMIQPVYAFGRIAALRSAARSGVDVGHARVDLARWELRVRMAQAYYGVLLSRELETILDDGRRWLAKAEARMERLRIADADEYDQMEHLRLKTRSSELFQLEADQRQLDVTSRAGLRLLLSRPADHAVEPATSTLVPIELGAVTVERLLAAMERHHPKLRMARAAGSAKGALADSKAAELWPQVVFVADASVNDSNVLETEGTLMEGETIGYSIAVLLGMRWYLDVPQRLAARDKARAEAEVALAEADVARDLAEIEVRRVYQALQDKRALIDIYAKSRKAAKGWLTAAWDTHDAGFGSFRNVMDALLQHYSKRLAHLQAVHEYNIMVHELSRAIGADVAALDHQAQTRKMNDRAPATSDDPVTP
jgi:outer membrane protein TolC